MAEAQHPSYDRIIDVLDEGILLLDAAGTLIDSNPAAARLLAPGAAGALPVGRPLAEIAPTLAALLGAPGASIEMSGSGPVPAALEARIYPLTQAGGGAILVLRDITVYKRRELFERDQRALAEALYDTALVLNSTLALNDILDHMLTYMGRVLPSDRSNVMLIDDHGIAKVVRSHGYDAAWGTVLEATAFEVAATVNLRHMLQTRAPLFISDTATYPGWIVVEPIPIRSYLGAPICIDEQVVGFLNLDSVHRGYYTNQHARRLEAFAVQAALAIRNARLYAAMESAATIDSLTGLATRRHWYTRAAELLEHARHTGTPLAMMMVDIDHFKQVNDTYGHIAGDQIIQAVAQRIRQSLRFSDMLGRYGGEEYVVLLPETTLEEAVQIAERLRGIVEETAVALQGASIGITISIGVARWQLSHQTVDALLHSADLALYAAKQAGRNQVRTAPS